MLTLIILAMHFSFDHWGEDSASDFVLPFHSLARHLAREVKDLSVLIRSTNGDTESDFYLRLPSFAWLRLERHKVVTSSCTCLDGLVYRWQVTFARSAIFFLHNRGYQKTTKIFVPHVETCPCPALAVWLNTQTAHYKECLRWTHTHSNINNTIS